VDSNSNEYSRFDVGRGDFSPLSLAARRTLYWQLRGLTENNKRNGLGDKRILLIGIFAFAAVLLREP
jgi:hypothetical protein